MHLEVKVEEGLQMVETQLIYKMFAYSWTSDVTIYIHICIYIYTYTYIHI